MRVLVACEFSGIVRDAFAKMGHDAWSCDLQPTERPGQHIQGDVTPLLRERWDLVVAHPDCTYLTNSGVRWLWERWGRWADMKDAAKFFKLCLKANSPRICVENPIPHGYALNFIGRKYDQVIQPWQFGHGETKATCFWLKGLKPLAPTNIVDGRKPVVHHAAPGPDRKNNRSRTYEGIAKAMAEQWSTGVPF